jgi:hypothetical protein
MKNKISVGMKKLLKPSLYIILSILVGVTAVYAVDKLTAPSAPANTMYSLTDIFNLASGTTTTEGTGTIETTPTTVATEGTGKTLTQVYTAIKDQLDLLTVGKLAKNQQVFGKTGTLYGDTDPSKVLNTATYPGTATSGPATLVWQTDPGTYLCWSYNQYEIESGDCSVGSGFIQTPDTNTTLGAVEYCKYLNTNGTTLANTEINYWHLPTIQEYTSITDYTLFNSATTVTGFAEGSNYWSSTEDAVNPNDAWFWFTYNGVTNNYDKNYVSSVRCAH